MGKAKYLVFLGSLFLMAFGLPEKLDKKVRKEITSHFGMGQFQLQDIAIPHAVSDQLPMAISESNFFGIYNGDDNSLTGYAFVDRAPSKTAQFDYLVLFCPDLKVVHSKVLIYREEYGGEIGSKRWLRQFLGMSGKDRVAVGENVDGISGATISVRSMTRSMDNLLQSIGILREKGILDHGS
ncbi:MAG: FMN-binding protein [Flavobacteriaceae bacterium]